MKKSSVALILLLVLLAHPPNMNIRGVLDVRGEDGYLDGVRDDLRYAVITIGEFKEAFEPLVEWKTLKGVPGEIFLLDGDDGILKNYPGRDDPEKIHTFLRDLKAHSPSLTWVLLGGDSEVVPSRKLYVNWSYEEGSDIERDTVVSDYYYAGLSSDWDTDGDGVYGEEGEQDFRADVFVGRLPVSSAREAKGAVEKILRYEITPPPGAWASTALFAGALMDRPNVLDNLSTPYDEGYDYYKDNGYEAIKRCLEHVPANVTAFTLYDYDRIRGGGYTPAEDSLNRTLFMEYWKAGYSVVGTVSHGLSTGEGLVDYAGLSGGFQHLWADYDVYLAYNDPEAYSNGDRLPLLYASSCASGRYQEEDDTNLERLVVNPSGGVIALIGATSDTYRGEFLINESSYGNWWLIENFFRIFYSGHYSPGEALYLLKEEYENHVWEPQNPYQNQSEFRIYRTDILAYNLLGDPEVPIYTASPERFNVTHPDVFYVEDNGFEVSVRDSSGDVVDGARVAITGGDVYMVEYTDSGGVARFDLSLKDLSPLNLTVTKHNFIPYTSRINVSSRVDLALAGNVRIDPSIPTEGKRFYLNFTCVNLGDYPSPGTVVRASLKDSSGRSVDVMDRYLPPLSGGEWRNISLYFVAVRGKNTVEVTLDYTGTVLESNEENNVFHVTFTSNIPVRIGGIPSQVLNEDTPPPEPINLSMYTLDPDSYPEDVSYWAESVGGHVVCRVEGNLLYLKPERDFYGEERVRVWASDGASNTSYIFTVIVRPVNDPPSLPEVINVTAIEDRTTTFNVTVLDPDSDTFEVKVDEPFVWRWISDNVIELNVTPGNDLIGVNIFNLWVSDGVNNTTARIVLKVLNVNDPPHVELPERVEATAGEILKVPISAYDPDGDSMKWELIGDFRNTPGVRIENNTLILPIPQNMKGEKMLIILFRDSNNATGEGEMVVVISPPGKERVVSSISLKLLVVVVILVTVTVLISIWWERRGKERPLLSGWARQALPEPEKDLKSRDFKDRGESRPPGDHKKKLRGEGPLTEDLEEAIEEVSREIFEEK